MPRLRATDDLALSPAATAATGAGDQDTPAARDTAAQLAAVSPVARGQLPGRSRETPAATSARTAKGSSSAHAVRRLDAGEIAHGHTAWLVMRYRRMP